VVVTCQGRYAWHCRILAVRQQVEGSSVVLDGVQAHPVALTFATAVYVTLEAVPVEKVVLEIVELWTRKAPEVIVSRGERLQEQVHGPEVTARGVVGVVAWK
jgi:hypothetical protein